MPTRVSSPTSTTRISSGICDHWPDQSHTQGCFPGLLHRSSWDFYLEGSSVRPVFDFRSGARDSVADSEFVQLRLPSCASRLGAVCRCRARASPTGISIAPGSPGLGGWRALARGSHSSRAIGRRRVLVRQTHAARIAGPPAAGMLAPCLHSSTSSARAPHSSARCPPSTSRDAPRRTRRSARQEDRDMSGIQGWPGLREHI